MELPPMAVYSRQRKRDAQASNPSAQEQPDYAVYQDKERLDIPHVEVPTAEDIIKMRSQYTEGPEIRGGVSRLHSEDPGNPSASYQSYTEGQHIARDYRGFPQHSEVIYDLDKQSNIYKEFNTRKLLKRGGGTSDDVVERPVKQQKLEDGTEVTPDSEELDGLEEEDDGDLLIRDEDLDDDEELDDELDEEAYLDEGELKEEGAATRWSSRNLIKCTECSSTFTDNKKLLVHIRTVHKATIEHFCQICKKSFSSISTLNKHMFLHTPPLNTDTKCKECDKSFIDPNRLIRHVKAMHRRGTYTSYDVSDKVSVTGSVDERSSNKDPTDNSCEECGETFTQPYLLKRHQQKQHGVSFNTCTHEKCGMKFPDHHSLRRHVEQNHSRRMEYPCVVCEETFTDRMHMFRHKYEEHNLECDFMCRGCDQFFDDLKKLRQHSKQEHGSAAEWQCNMCKQVFMQRATMDRHRYEVHNSYIDSFCPECDKFFEDPRSIIRHNKEVHGKITDWQCNKCTASFNARSGLDKHRVMIHNETADCMCDECGKYFEAPRSLRRHKEQMHSKYSEWSCRDCNYTYTNRSEYDHHRSKVHLDESDVYCNECDKYFDSIFLLRKHNSEVHGREEELMCRACDQTFKSKAARDSHRYHVHEDEVDTMCMECERFFEDQRALQRHVKISHTSKKPIFTCAECSAGFPYPVLVDRHRHEEHEESIDTMCISCDKFFEDKQMLERHLIRAHGEGGETLDTQAAHKIWSCEPCNLLFNQRSRLHAHQHKIHNELVEHCEHCALYFESTTEFKQHMFVKHGVDINWTCPKCDEQFDKKVELDKHRRDIHYEKINTICQYCDKVFEGPALVQRHIRRVHESQTKHTCSYDDCDETFMNKLSLSKHLYHGHGVPVNPMCVECDLFFTNQKDFSKHNRENHSVKPEKVINCDKCSSSFKNAADLLRHLHDVHEEARRQYCEKCDLYFGNRKALYRHRVAIHAADKEEDMDELDDRPDDDDELVIYRCLECNISKFPSKTVYMNHIRLTHDREWDTYCFKCTTHQQTSKRLLKHMREVHKIPFFCARCELVFDKRSALDKHLREKDLKRVDTYCEACDKYFEELRGKERHHKTMHNSSEQMYSCDPCGEVFELLSALEFHRRNVHNETVDTICEICGLFISDSKSPDRCDMK